MEGISYFDLSLTSDGKFYDISFERKKLEKNVGLTKICENPLIEQCEEKEETIKFNDDDSEEEDTSIIKICEGIKYLTFPGIRSVYTVDDLKYVGSIDEEGSINFAPLWDYSHVSFYKITKFETYM